VTAEELLSCVQLNVRRSGRRGCLVQEAMKGEIPGHFDVFRSTMSQQHGYNTRNGYMPKIGKPRME